MLGTTVLALTLVSLEITPTRVVEAFVSPRLSLVKRELVIPESGVAIIAEPSTTDFHALFISPESKGDVLDVEVALNDENPLYQIRGTSGAKVYIFAEQDGLTWVGSYSAQHVDYGRLQFCAKRIVSNRMEDLSNLKITLVADCWEDDLIPNFEDAIRFPQPEIPTAISFGEPNLSTEELTYNPAFCALVLSNWLRVLEDIQNIQKNYPEETQILNSIDNFSLKKGTDFEIKVFDGLYKMNQVRRYSLPITASYRSKLTLAGEFKGAEQIIVNGIPNTYLPAGQVPISVDGKVVFKGTIGESYGDSVASIFIREIEENPKVVEREISRRRFSIKNLNYDSITMTATVSMFNRESYPAGVQIIKAFDGEVLSKDEGLESHSRRLDKREINLASAIVWNTILKPGESKSINYTYRVTVDSAQK